MYALCVSGAVNTQGFVWKFFYALYINFHSFSFIQEEGGNVRYPFHRNAVGTRPGGSVVLSTAVDSVV